MATLVLGTIGRALGGPIGGILGTLAGGFVDRAVFGGGATREGPRLGNLAVQGSAYGEPIPHVHGRLRIAGNLIWTTGIIESIATSGGGKRSGPATTSYSYAASFAVALCGREIAGIGRVWADGKVVRDSGGAWLTPVTMRLHKGADGQPVDPLVAAAEPGGAPAYGGIAYVVFEDLPLADYGNRIPNLTFEIIADGGAIDAGVVMKALALAADVPLAVSGTFPALTGHVAARPGSLSLALEPLVALSAARLSGLGLRGDGTAATAVPGADADATSGTAVSERRRREAADALPDVFEVGYFDPARDYQNGLQRARRGLSSGRVDRVDLPMAFTADAAKVVAEASLSRAALRRHHHVLRLPWRHAGIDAGDRVTMDDGSIWRVRERRFEGFVQALDLEACEVVSVAPVAADGGRPFAFHDTAPGPTVIHVFELPPLAGALPAQPQMWIAAAGASPGWRRAGIELSTDAGASYSGLGVAEAGAVLGVVQTILPPGPRDLWDEHGWVDVELLADAMWLESRSPESVLAGANLALVGTELLQFSTVTALGPRRFRLGGLLRGRRGSEAAITSHFSGERFVLIVAERLLRFDAPVELIGSTVMVRAAGAGDPAPVGTALPTTGQALQPLSPAGLVAVTIGGGAMLAWQRRSRAGFGWADFVDAPLGEDLERYRVYIRRAGVLLRTAEVERPAFDYTAAMRAADGNGVVASVCQLSAQVGPGAPATLTLPD